MEVELKWTCFRFLLTYLLTYLLVEDIFGLALLLTYRKEKRMLGFRELSRGFWNKFLWRDYRLIVGLGTRIYQTRDSMNKRKMRINKVLTPPCFLHQNAFFSKVAKCTTLLYFPFFLKKKVWSVKSHFSLDKWQNFSFLFSDFSFLIFFILAG
jgi:hypothetical protein